MDTFEEMFAGVDPQPHPSQVLAAPGTVGGTPAAVDPHMKGLGSLHPGYSPTPWVIGFAILLVLLMHPKAGFKAGGSVNVG